MAQSKRETAPVPFTEASLKFLRGLKKNNDREWFNQRKSVYEQELKAPMLGLIEQVNHAFADFAPEFIRPPHKVMLRIFRDTRFAADKRPYKNQISAWWGGPGMAKTSGAGFYFSLSATEITFAAGIFMPTPNQLLAIRRHLLKHHPAMRRQLASSRLREVFTLEDGRPLTRPPKGFSPTDPAVAFALDLLLQRRWGVSATRPAVDKLNPSESATAPDLATKVANAFRLATPLVRLLNQPLIEPFDTAAPPPRKPLF